MFDATATLKRPPTPPVTLLKAPLTKRRRLLLPYQGPDLSDDSRSIRSTRIKRWTLSMGRRERERIKSLHVQQNAPSASDHLRIKTNTDEISSERGVELLNERGGMLFIYLCSVDSVAIMSFADPAGSRLPVHLHSSTRAPTLQHIADRMNLICAQNSLSAPLRSVPALMALACEVCYPKNPVLRFPIGSRPFLGQVKAAYHSCPNSNFNLTCHQFHCTIFE